MSVKGRIEARRALKRALQGPIARFMRMQRKVEAFTAKPKRKRKPVSRIKRTSITTVKMRRAIIRSIRASNTLITVRNKPGRKTFYDRWY